VPEASDELSILFRRANRGDGAAYREVLLALTPRVRALARRGLTRAGRSTDEAEDIVQDALLAIHLKRHTWDESQPLLPWVHAITSYKLIDTLRRRGARDHVVLDDLAEDLPAEAAPDVATTIDRARLISGLSDRQRRIVEGIAIEGRSAREIAAGLDMSEGAVRVALHRALKAMGDIVRRGET
jgi:RNA polymerase sigma-70 factor (ECF subfamily)